MIQNVKTSMNKTSTFFLLHRDATNPKRKSAKTWIHRNTQKPLLLTGWTDHSISHSLFTSSPAFSSTSHYLVSLYPLDTADSIQSVLITSAVRVLTGYVCCLCLFFPYLWWLSAQGGAACGETERFRSAVIYRSGGCARITHPMQFPHVLKAFHQRLSLWQLMENENGYDRI